MKDNTTGLDLWLEEHLPEDNEDNSFLQISEEGLFIQDDNEIDDSDSERCEICGTFLTGFEVVNKLELCWDCTTDAPE